MTSIYLDHAASTPVDAQVVEAMLPYWTIHYGNPSSSHKQGRAASHGLETARRTIASQMDAKPSELAFTGCGSESDNLAIRGVMHAARANQSGDHLIVSCIEHSAVLKTAVQLRDHFEFELTILPVDSHGMVDLDDLQAAIRPETALISIMAANNEIGTMQPIQQIGKIARQHGVLFHTDGVQAAIGLRWDMAKMPIDLLTLAPHKFYGPKGIGILYVRDGVNLLSPLTGGAQEGGRRAGTENVAFAVGAAKAFSLAQELMDERVAHYTEMRDYLIEGVLTTVNAVVKTAVNSQTSNQPSVVLTGHPTQRLPHNASFAFRNVDGNALLMHLDMAGILASSGSACKTGNPKPSAVLEAIGLSDEWSKGGLRLTVGTQTSREDIEYVIKTLPSIIKKLTVVS